MTFDHPYLKKLARRTRIDDWVRLDVPEVAPSIEAALAFCKQVLPKLTGHGFIQIKLADGVYHTWGIEIDFFSDRVEIMGNMEDPNRVLINVDNRDNRCGFLLQRGNGIYKIDGMTINGTQAWQGYGRWANEAYGAGIMCNYNSQLLVGSRVRVNHFYYGIAARYGSSIRCEAGVIVQQAGDVGFFAYAASLDAQACEAYHCADLEQNLGFGFCAEQGGHIDAATSKAAHNHVAGFYALSNGAMWCHDTSSSDNRHGFLALLGGVLTCNSINRHTNAYQNFGYGYVAEQGGIINANRALGNENGQGGFLAKYQATIDITQSAADFNGGNGYTAINATLLGDGASARFNQGDGFNACHQGYLDGLHLAAHHNHHFGFAIVHAQAHIPYHHGTYNQKGRLFHKDSLGYF